MHTHNDIKIRSLKTRTECYVDEKGQENRLSRALARRPAGCVVTDYCRHNYRGSAQNLLGNTKADDVFVAVRF